MAKVRQPFFWIFYHPHQKFWNWALIRAFRKVVRVPILVKAFNWLVVQFDTCFLLLRTRVYRISKCGISTLGTKASIPNNFELIYLDIGTHEAGNELAYFLSDILPSIAVEQTRIYGFEASLKSFKSCQERFKSQQNVELIHTALVNEIPEDGTIKLYEDSAGGLADSIYRKTDKFQSVRAQKLSQFLKERNAIGADKIVLLRMNIEGAEFDVIKDVVEAGLTENIAGYFGMWDDLSKIDLQKDREFRKMLKRNSIHPFTFNGRDLNWRGRKKMIKYHVHSCLINHLKKELN